ncbi:winged helix DNA-binding domain-containing protein [Streptomyces sp. SL13]|uniref:Winged helix DNA-binding domain-containing protein n=1 Tax=Streptantibioticus silvisoli TaxID=2705255 RepID=A0AA90KBW6_9ACTN|nr:winged helix DNA-binding domain-containing protein [Streptantibioticus silvisoli]MDI5974203.1 winged helix DNA-binding domain-containing protein [Streptantibioticus silvisoli]
MAGAAEGAVLDRRRLNRAYLARQWLLRREPRGALEAVQHLVGLQAQHPNPPYAGLFSRLEGFRFGELADLMLQRAVTRGTLMRGTVHLASARDLLALRPLLQPHLARQINGTPYGKAVPAAGRAELLDFGRRLLDEQPRTVAELRQLLGERWPDRHADALAHVLRFELPTVHVPPRGVWGRGGRATHATVESWLGAPLDPEPDRAVMLRRYLAAFGPATAADVTAWSGMTGWRPTVERLRPALVVHRDACGRELFDLPGAPLPPADTPAPVRLVAEFDNLTLSHADRTRIVAEADRPRLMSRNGIVPGTLLVDGFVAGTWRWDLGRTSATLTVTPWSRLTPADRAAAESEAHALLAAAAPEAAPRVAVGTPE